MMSELNFAVKFGTEWGHIACLVLLPQESLRDRSSATFEKRMKLIGAHWLEGNFPRPVPQPFTCPDAFCRDERACLRQAGDALVIAIAQCSVKNCFVHKRSY
jgi:hypothetical protein